MADQHSFDPACAELAEHFLTDERHGKGDADSLAQAIQDAVEMWFVGRADHGPSDENIHR